MAGSYLSLSLGIFLAYGNYLDQVSSPVWGSHCLMTVHVWGWKGPGPVASSQAICEGLSPHGSHHELDWGF
jgi:hypothetical protein